MPASRKSLLSASNEVRVTLPRQLLEAFAKHPRVVIKHRPDGIWPVNPEMMQKIDWNKLAVDKQFTSKFEVIIMPK